MTPAPLTPTEERILALIREGRVDAEIAVQLGLSVGDLKARVERLMTKTGATSRAAIRPGAVWPQPASQPVEAMPVAISEPPRPASPWHWSWPLAVAVVLGAALVGAMVGFALRRQPDASQPTAPAVQSLQADPVEAPPPVAPLRGSLYLQPPLAPPDGVVLVGLRRTDGQNEVVRWTAGRGVEVLLSAQDASVVNLESDPRGALLVASVCIERGCDPGRPLATRVLVSEDAGRTWKPVPERGQRVETVLAAAARAPARDPMADGTASPLEGAPAEVWLGGARTLRVAASGADLALGGTKPGDPLLTAATLTFGNFTLQSAAAPYESVRQRGTRTLWGSAWLALREAGDVVEGVRLHPVTITVNDQDLAWASVIALPYDLLGDGFLVKAVLTGGWTSHTPPAGRDCTPLRESASEFTPILDCVPPWAFVRPAAGGAILGEGGAWVRVESQLTGAEGWLPAAALAPASP
ncbi:MAG: helix-turn-helix transcriptional regulator [Dehalococcoidia bacterium]